MKLKLPKFAVLGLVIPVFFSAIFCCCLTDSLHAQEPEPSCHSTNHQSATHQNANDCGSCDRTMAVNQGGAVMDIAVAQTVTQAIVHQTYNLFELAAVETAEQPLPLVYDTSPLYAKYSVLRL